MTARAVLLGLVACVLGQVQATPATAEAELKAPIHYLGDADERLCPSPMCGGIWLTAVNGASGNCSRPRGEECYVTGLAFHAGVDDAKQARLSRLVAEGGGLVRGSMTHTNGFPDLRALFVSGVWRPASARSPAGVVRRLHDNGVRCITTPCFSIGATALNAGRSTTVSAIDLGRAGASAEERRWAMSLIARRGLLAAGRIVRAPDGGRTFVASQIYLPAR